MTGVDTALSNPLCWEDVVVRLPVWNPRGPSLQLVESTGIEWDDPTCSSGGLRLADSHVAAQEINLTPSQ